MMRVRLFSLSIINLQSKHGYACFINLLMRGREGWVERMACGLREDKAKDALQEESEKETSFAHLNAYIHSNIRTEGESGEIISTWHGQKVQKESTNADLVLKKPVVKKHLLYRNRGSAHNNMSRLENRQRRKCVLEDDKIIKPPNRLEARNKHELADIFNKPKCAISVLSPHFRREDIKHDYFHMSGSVLNKLFLPKQKEAYHEKRGLVIKKIKRDIINGQAFRGENSSTYSTIMQENSRMTSILRSTNKKEKICSEVHLRLQLRTQADHSTLMSTSIQQETIPKAPRHHSVKQRHTNTRSLFKQNLNFSRDDITNEQLRSTHQFRMLQSLLSKERE